MPEENQNPAPAAPVETAKEFEAKLEKAYHERRRLAMRGGPVYHDPESAPLVWYDQLFERELTPSGTVDCANSLRAGGTQNALDLILVASNANTAAVQAAAGATITVRTLQCDTPDGIFEAIGPTHCVTAPTDGIAAERNMLFCRVALGNFRKPWLKISLEFSGTITGGTLDACLSYAAR